MSGEGDLLVLLLDVTIFKLPSTATSGTMLEQVLYFTGAYLMLQDDNRLAVYALEVDACHLLYASLGNDHSGSNDTNPTHSIAIQLVDMLQARAAKLQGVEPVTPPSVTLSSGLSRALCLLNRVHLTAQRRAGMGNSGGLNAATSSISSHDGGAGACKPRVLCIMASPDGPSQYVPVMNAIFSAQRLDVTIDSLMLRGDSVYLQQAAHLTGGLYLQLSGGSQGGAKLAGQPQRKPGGAVGAAATSDGRKQHSAADKALQCLMTCFTTGTATRAMLRVHQPQGVDFRAACFCHKQPVDLGYVCSVCLSIFCEPCQQCAICGTSFSSLPAAP